MNLIFIYGPPASGKLTVAEQLAEQTGYKLFHNHLTMDLAQEIYPEFDETRFNLVDKLRLDVFEYAAQNDTSIVTTFVYSGGEGDDKFISDTAKAITGNGGKVFFVQLDAPDEVLIERVSNSSRQKFHKLKDATTLLHQLKAGNYRASVKQSGVLKLNSSKLEPSESAKMIVEHFKLSYP